MGCVPPFVLREGEGDVRGLDSTYRVKWGAGTQLHGDMAPGCLSGTESVDQLGGASAPHWSSINAMCCSTPKKNYFDRLLPILELYVNEIRQNIAIYVWLLSLRTMHLSFAHVAGFGRDFLFQSCIVFHHTAGPLFILSTHQSVDICDRK